MALHFECRINKNTLPVFGDFAHWDIPHENTLSESETTRE